MSLDNNWLEFMKLNKIGKRFQNIMLDEVYKLKPEFKEIFSKFIINPFSLLLSGNPGLGKTYTLLALIKELLKDLSIYDFRFFKCKNLDDILFEKFKDNNLKYFINILCETKILFIDDFGIDKSSERLIRDLYEIIDRRWENLMTTVISTNLSEMQIKNIYGDRIFSRMSEMTRIIFIGKDLR